MKINELFILIHTYFTLSNLKFNVCFVKITFLGCFIINSNMSDVCVCSCYIRLLSLCWTASIFCFFRWRTLSFYCPLSLIYRNCGSLWFQWVNSNIGYWLVDVWYMVVCCVLSSGALTIKRSICLTWFYGIGC